MLTASIRAGDLGDVICAGAGNDRINGRGGADRIYAGSGNDTVTTDSGNDYVFAGSGSDTVSTGADTDPIYGDNRLGKHADPYDTGADGNDVIYGGRGLLWPSATRATPLGNTSRFPWASSAPFTSPCPTNSPPAARANSAAHCPST